MAHQFSPDVEKLVQEQMAAGGYGCQEELIRDALQALDERRRELTNVDPEIVAGVRRGCQQSASGLGQSFDLFDAECRSKNKFQFDA